MATILEGKCSAVKCDYASFSNKNDKQTIICASPFCNKTFHLQCVGHKGKKASSLYFLCVACEEFITYSNSSLEKKLCNLEQQVKDILSTVNTRITAVEEKFKTAVNEMDEKISTCVINSEKATDALKIKFDEMERKIESLEGKVSNFCTASNEANEIVKSPKIYDAKNHNSSLKFQLRIAGIKEAEEGQKYLDRQQHDIQNVEMILTHINRGNCKITDCFRLGKYKKESKRPRYVLVTFSSVWDRNMVLQSSKLLSNFQAKVFISPALNTQEMEIEKALLKKRYELISSGVNREQIKIKNLKLFVDDKQLPLD